MNNAKSVGARVLARAGLIAISAILMASLTVSATAVETSDDDDATPSAFASVSPVARPEVEPLPAEVDKVVPVESDAEPEGETPADVEERASDESDDDAFDADPDADPDDVESDPEADPDVDLLGSDPVSLTIGDLVWMDTNDDGVLDAEEGPISIVRLELFADADRDGQADDQNGDGSITSNDALAVTTSGVDGAYAFTGLDPGVYVVGIPPSEWGRGRSLVGLMASTGTICSCGYVMSRGIEVGTEDLSVDFGFWQPRLDVALAIESPESAEPGSTITFVITATNQGNVTAADLTIVNTLPAGLTLDDPAWTTAADGSISYTFATTLDAGASQSIPLRVRLDQSAAGTIESEVEVANLRGVDAFGASLVLPPGNPVSSVTTSSTASASVSVAQVTPTQPNQPTLPVTGSTAGLIATGGLALLLLGIGIVTFASVAATSSVPRFRNGNR